MSDLLAGRRPEGLLAGTPAGSAFPGWNKIQTADIVPDGLGALIPYSDPHGTSWNVAGGVAAPLACNDGTGELTYTLRTDLTLWDGPRESAAWRTRLLTAAYGWRGDGSQEIQLWWIPTNNPNSARSPMIMGGLVDRNEDISDVASIVNAAGFCWRNLTEVYIAYAESATSGAVDLGGDVVYAGNTPSILVHLIPVGPIGDNTNVGPVVAALGHCVASVWTNVVSPVYFTCYSVVDGVTAVPTDGIGLQLFAGFNIADGARTQVTVKGILLWRFVDTALPTEWD